jgi:hypothetical protein
MGDYDEIKTLLQITLTSVNNNLTTQQQMITQLQQENQELKRMVHELTKARGITTLKNPLENEVISKFKRNKKRMIKNKILETIKDSALSIPEIKEVVVDQFKYCSKATFYRYIEELKRHDFIHINEQEIVKIKPMVDVV